MPYQSQPLFEDALASGTLGALNATAALTLNNASGAIVNISGTWVGTIIFDGTNDDFVTIQNAAVFTPPAGVIASGVTSNGYYRFVAVSGFTKIRARMSSYTSGNAAIVISASLGSGLAPTVSVNYDSMLGTSKLTGNSDGTKIGNVNDSLKVTMTQSSGSGGGPSGWSKKLRYDDMNASTGGVARDTVITALSSWNNVYSYSGSGLLSGWALSLESVTDGDWNIRMIIDGEEIFGSNGISLSDMTDAAIYGLNRVISDISSNGINLSVKTSPIYWSGPLDFPIEYKTSIVIKVQRNTGKSSKKFKAGLIVLSKET